MTKSLAQRGGERLLGLVRALDYEPALIFRQGGFDLAHDIGRHFVFRIWLHRQVAELADVLRQNFRVPAPLRR